MAQLFPSKQTFVDLRDETQVLLSTVKILTTASDHLELPNAVDVAVFTTDDGADPAFYLGTTTSDGVAGDRVSIQDAVIGTEYIVVSNHVGGVNFFPGSATPDSPK